jgi:hypothetical protein
LKEGAGVAAAIGLWVLNGSEPVLQQGGEGDGI